MNAEHVPLLKVSTAFPIWRTRRSSANKNSLVLCSACRSRLCRTPSDAALCAALQVRPLRWAVAEAYRGQGKAGVAVLASLRKMRNGFARAGMKAFWVEAIVGEDNIASQKLAQRVTSAPVEKSTVSTSGDPIVQYLRRIVAQAEL